MAELKLTKNELRAQQGRLGQLKKYLPTLQLKKAMLQAEVTEARIEIIQLQKAADDVRVRIRHCCSLLSEKTSLDPAAVVRVKEVHKRWENIAGVEVPYFDGVDFEPFEYSLFETPPWTDSVVAGLREMVGAELAIEVAEQKKAALEKELREVSIRVNLFEKVLIPRAEVNIKRIKVFLGDQELAAVCQAKVAKTKIEMKKATKAEELFYAN